jgi:hypothetical protein
MGGVNDVPVAPAPKAPAELSELEVGLFGAAAGAQQGARIALGEILSNPVRDIDLATAYADLEQYSAALIARSGGIGIPARTALGTVLSTDEASRQFMESALKGVNEARDKKP